jgi:hypothetical protein
VKYFLPELLSSFLINLTSCTVSLRCPLLQENRALLVNSDVIRCVLLQLHVKFRLKYICTELGNGNPSA